MVQFLEKAILYRNDALILAGVVMIPQGGPHPRAVFIHGSGYSDSTNPWYQEIARYLACHGIAVLLPILQLFLKRMWPRWQDVRDFDPIPLWETLPVPGLIIFGEDDEFDNVPVKESVRRLNAAIQRNPRANLTIKVFKGSGYDLRDPEAKRIRRDFLNLLTKWVNAVHKLSIHSNHCSADAPALKLKTNVWRVENE